MTANQGKWFRQDASGQDAFPIAAPLSPPPLAGLVPAAESSDFTQMAMHVVQQLAGVRASFVTLLEVRKIINLCSVCSRMDLHDEQHVYRQGDESNFLGFILSGKFEILHGGHKLLDLLVGDMVGEIELCNPQGESSNRQHTLVASGKGVIARIAYEDFVSFVEGLGPRNAKRLSRHLADYVLAKVVKQQEDGELVDRSRLENVGRTRRKAVSSACPTDHSWNPHDPQKEPGKKAITLSIPALQGYVSPMQPANVDQPTGASTSEMHVPFYFEKQPEGWSAMKDVIESTMSRIPCLAYLDTELKKKLTAQFLVANKKSGQFIMHWDHKVEYFFIVYKGEAGTFAQIPWANSAADGESANSLQPALTSSNVSNGTSPGFRRLPSNASMGSQGGQRKGSGAVAQSPFPSTRGSAVITSARRSGVPGTPGRPPSSVSLRETQEGESLTRVSSSESVRLIDTIAAHSDVTSMMTKATNAKKAARSIRRTKSSHKHYEVVKTIDEGEWFGDMGLILELSFSDVNVKAVSEVSLLMLPIGTFHEMRDAFEKRIYSTRIKLVQNCPFGHLLGTEQVSNIADALITRSFRAGENVVNLESTDFLMLQSGVAVEMKNHIRNMSAEGGKVSAGSTSSVPTRSKKNHKIPDSDPNKIREHCEGSCFCEWHLSVQNMQNMDARAWQSTGAPVNPIINAMTDCVFLVLDRKSFIDLIGSYDALMAGRDACADLEPETDTQHPNQTAAKTLHKMGIGKKNLMPEKSKKGLHTQGSSSSLIKSSLSEQPKDKQHSDSPSSKADTKQQKQLAVPLPNGNTKSSPVIREAKAALDKVHARYTEPEVYPSDGEPSHLKKPVPPTEPPSLASTLDNTPAVASHYFLQPELAMTLQRVPSNGSDSSTSQGRPRMHLDPSTQRSFFSKSLAGKLSTEHVASDCVYIHGQSSAQLRGTSQEAGVDGTWYDGMALYIYMYI